MGFPKSIWKYLTRRKIALEGRFCLYFFKVDWRKPLNIFSDAQVGQTPKNEFNITFFNWNLYIGKIVYEKCTTYCFCAPREKLEGNMSRERIIRVNGEYVLQKYSFLQWLNSFIRTLYKWKQYLYRTKIHIFRKFSSKIVLYWSF